MKHLTLILALLLWALPAWSQTVPLIDLTCVDSAPDDGFCDSRTKVLNGAGLDADVSTPIYRAAGGSAHVMVDMIAYTGTAATWRICVDIVAGNGSTVHELACSVAQNDTTGSFEVFVGAEGTYGITLADGRELQIPLPRDFIIRLDLGGTGLLWTGNVALVWGP